LLSIYVAVFLPFLVASLVLLLLQRRKMKRHLGWFILPVPIILFILLCGKVAAVKSGATFSYTWTWIPTYAIQLLTYVDGLSLLFALLITGIGILVILYSIYYLSTDQALTHFYIYILLFMGSMLGIVFSNHLLTLYVFWELTSISSFLLIAYWYQRKGSRYGAKKSLIITVFGGFAMLAAFLMIYTITGTFNIQEVIGAAHLLKEHELFIPVIVLLLLGAFTKSAQFPFHIWLPDAMEAPTPISAYLHSATMVKAGIYLVARFTPVFGGSLVWFWAITAIGLMTLLWGSFTAIRQTDLKALLAYSTVSQLGLIMSLFGIGSLSLHPNVQLEPFIYTHAVFAALFHLVNHSTFKGSLFMVIGIIDYQLGTRDLRRLGGLIALMPISFTVALIGSFSMAGLPPFNGFLSKEMFFTAVLHVAELDLFSYEAITTFIPIVAWIASIFTFVYSMMIVWQAFTGKRVDVETAGEAQEPKVGMLIPPITLATFVVLIFFFPNVLGDYILKPAVSSVYPNVSFDMIERITHWHGFNKELWMTIGIVIIGTILYRFRNVLNKIFILFPENMSFNTVYNVMIAKSDQLAWNVTSRYMTGYLRHYFIYIFLFFALLVSALLFALQAQDVTLGGNKVITVFDWLLAISIIIAGVTIVIARTRLTAILINGYIGFAIAMFFVIFRAPDLALTQLIVETVTTALFLLCFYFLPKWELPKLKRAFDIRALIISILVGTTFTLVALSVHNNRLFTSISTFFEDAKQLTGGENIVNTILADFRAFDTMLEVIVLFIAGIGVLTLIKYSTNKGADKLED